MADPLFTRFGREFAAGDVLFREGDAGNEMFIVQSGSIRISKVVGTTEKIFAVLGPGEFLGEMAILNAKPRSATATVVDGPARCLVIDAQTLEIMVTKNAEIAIRLIKKLAKRLESADTLIDILMRQDPTSRALLGLIHAAETSPTQDDEEGLHVAATAAQLADKVGVHAEVTQDLFQRLHRLRLIHQGKSGQVVIRNLGRLREFHEFLEGKIA